MSTQSPPLSVRFGPDRLEKIDTYAGEKKLKRHAAILEIVDIGLETKTAPKTAVCAKS